MLDFELVRGQRELAIPLRYDKVMSGRGENPAKASGHDATPPVKVTPTTNGMGGAGTSARVVP